MKSAKSAQTSMWIAQDSIESRESRLNAYVYTQLLTHTHLVMAPLIYSYSCIFTKQTKNVFFQGTLKFRDVSNSLCEGNRREKAI